MRLFSLLFAILIPASVSAQTYRAILNWTSPAEEFRIERDSGQGFDMIANTSIPTYVDQPLVPARD